MSRAPLGHADNRPRIHIWPHADGVAWSTGPAGIRARATDPGAALNEAIDQLKPRSGAVVIIETAP